MVYLGANACIIGRNVEKTESVAADIATARKGAKVLGIGGCDVRDVCTALIVVLLGKTTDRHLARELEEGR
jgi:hypothetical protein